MNQHTLASIYFSNQNFYVFTVTQASFTMMASIGAFAASSDLLTPISKVWLNLAVGSISAMVVFLQTMNGVCGFGERAGQHQNLAIDLRDLRDDIALLKLKLQKVKADKEKAKAQHGDGYSYTTDSDDDSNSDEDEDEEVNKDNFESIQQRYQQSLAGCKSNCPMELSEAFRGLNSHLMVTKSLDNNLYMTQVYGHSKHENLLYLKAYDLLSAEILTYYFFPLILPNPKSMVKQTMARLNTELNKCHRYWEKQVKENFGNNKKYMKQSFFYSADTGGTSYPEEV